MVNTTDQPKEIKMTSLATLKQQRASSKGSLTRIRNLVEPQNSLSYIELECRLSMVDSYYKQALYYQSQIEDQDSTDAGRSEIDDLYVIVKSKIKTLMMERRPSEFAPPEHSFIVNTPVQHRLPALKLPQFNGTYSEYKNFINSFNILVNNDETISKIEKFNHLLACLSGEALMTIKTFQVTEANYDLAMARLKGRYDNDTLIFLENISALFEVPSIPQADSKKLRCIIDTVSALYDSLKALGSSSQILDAIIIHLLMTKVDPGTKQRWQDQLNYTSLPTWSSCSTMLENRCRHLDAQGKIVDNQSASQSNNNKSSKKGSKQHAFLTSSEIIQKSDKVCAFCSRPSHTITTCQNFIVLSTANRKEKVRQLKLCYNCLNKSHSVSECKSKHSCRFCKQRHHSLIHEQTESQFNTSSSQQSSSENPQSSVAVHTTLIGERPVPENTTVILATARILVQDSEGNLHNCRALLDSCSQANLLTNAFAHRLNLRKSKTSVNLSGVGDASVKLAFQTQTTIRSRVSDFTQSVEFLLTNRITGYQPDESISIEKLNLPSNLMLADPEFNVSKKIDALLGTDIFFSLLAAGRIQLGANLPMLQQTEFGWVVSGKCDLSVVRSSHLRSFCSTFDELNSNVEKLWHLEEIVTKPPKATSEQQKCEAHFSHYVQITSDNRIMVSLPFKSSPDALGNSRDIALKRLTWLERKLKKTPLLKKDYATFLKEYEQLGHMSLMKNPDLQQAHYFIPHHCVLKPTSETTKLRVVFDASCRSASQISLNDLLLVGPTIQNDLYITLIRFRLHKYGLMADISKMYRQILLNPDDRRFQYILWRENEDQPVMTYALNTVTYGTASAPYLAVKGLQFAAERFPKSYTLGKSVIMNDFYVDDMATGADDLVTLQKIKLEVSEILRYFNMELCKWHCSHANFNAFTDRDIQLDQETTSVLGITWKPSQDEFVFSFQAKGPMTTYTKRSILSFTSSFFDPLGLINPIIIVPRIILQQLWVQKLSWDEPVPATVERKFKDFLNDLQNLTAVHIPRFGLISNMIDAQVHGFCDASSKAYGCCLYIRCQDNFGNRCTNILTTKARVAPIKVTSLPRLELCSAHLLAKLWAKIEPHLSFRASEIHFWSDSQVTLHWIQSESSTLNVFVGNRVADIQSLVCKANWHHIKSSSNPADLISRGCSVNALQTSNWLHGPNFLLKEPNEWPLQSTSQLSENQLNLEKKKVFVINQHKVVPYVIKQIHNYSNYIKCVRVVAYMLRFKPFKQQKATFQQLSASEIRNSVQHIIWAIQHYHFSREITLLKHKKQIQGPLASLCLFIDSAGAVPLLRVGGRLVNADLPEQTKHPLLLPKEDQFVISMATHIHRSNFHAGPRALTALIQQEFWLVNCRSLATQIVHNCIHCTRYKPKLLTQIMGNLPKERVTECVPFDVTGVDFAGPISTFLKIRGKRPYKSYIAVFVCFASKAVHLEAVTELTSDAFIAALKRFVGRRGLPAKIVCDNATNFVGADNKLKEFRDFFLQQSTIDAVTSHCANQQIDFVFIPPRAPHFGGLWEAAVKIAKSHLYKTLSNARLTFEELATALVEIEAVMNSRPLTSLSTDTSDLSVLTSGEMLIGKKLKHIPEPVNIIKEISLLDRWKRITAAKAHFWRRWHAEYLCELQQRSRWQHPTRNLQVGDLVTIHDDNLPPMKWLVGRITEVTSGSDDKVRVAEIRTAGSTFTRPVHKLALLPVLNPGDSMEAGMFNHRAD